MGDMGRRRADECLGGLRACEPSQHTSYKDWLLVRKDLCPLPALYPVGEEGEEERPKMQASQHYKADTAAAKVTHMLLVTLVMRSIDSLSVLLLVHLVRFLPWASASASNALHLLNLGPMHGSTASKRFLKNLHRSFLNWGLGLGVDNYVHVSPDSKGHIGD